jgi:NAD(P)-dependent dehydrogenase (short-subunit alcohol dehydrogenase family)/pimeloyl-ACP methyl ester carboxylesterase
MTMEPAQFVTAGNVELAVYAWGTPAAGTPTVVLVHGYPDAASVWAATAERLAATHHVVAYDVRGAGRSTRPDHTAAYDLQHLVDDLAAVIDAVSPQRPVHLVGHDWGSIQSWEAVTTASLRGRIASYTTISGPSLDHAGYWLLQRMKSGSPEKLSQVARQAAHSWYIGMFHLPALAPAMWKLGGDQLWPAVLKSVEGIRAEASATQSRDGEHGVKLYRANVRKRVLKPGERRTDLPVQLIFPMRDRFMVAEIWDDLPQWAPKLWRRDVDAGHWLQVSHPQLLADHIAEFIAFVEGGVETPALRRARARIEHQGKPDAGKLVVVTGAGSGIGRETALTFAERGASIVAADIDAAAAERTAELARLLGVEAQAREVDVGRVAEMEAFASWVADTLGTPDVVVNNAGIGMAGPVLDTSADDWDRILRINLGGVIHGARLFGRQMVAAGVRGHIVNVSSGLAFFPTRATPAYATTKAAVQMLSECLRADLADQGIGVSAVYPGVVNTGIVERTRFVGSDRDTERQRQSRTQRLYQLRNLKPGAVARAIVDAVEHDRAEVLVGAEVHGIRLLSRFMPGVMRRLARVQLS